MVRPFGAAAFGPATPIPLFVVEPAGPGVPIAGSCLKKRGYPDFPRGKKEKKRKRVILKDQKIRKKKKRNEAR